MDFFLFLAEQKIREAIDRGDMDHLEGKGRPLVLDDFSDVPEELRMGYKVLKNAGVLPEEMELKREMLTLEDLLDSCRDCDERGRIRKKLTLKSLQFDMLMERNRRNASFHQYEGRISRRMKL